MKPLFTASEVKRLLECTGSVFLEKASVSNGASKWGDGLHSWREKAHKDNVKDSLWLPHAQSEQAFELDLSTGKARELNGGPEEGSRYPGVSSEFCITGRMDVGSREGLRGLVRDYKSGSSGIPPAQSNPQLLTLAVMAQRAWGLDSVIGQITFLYGGGGGHFTDECEWNSFELDGWFDVLVAIHERCRKAKVGPEHPTLRTGDWCQYCPSLRYCPTTSSLVSAFTGVPTDGMVTPENAGELRARVQVIKKLCDDAEDAIRRLAEQMDIALPNGKVLRLVESHRKSVNAKALPFLLLERGFKLEQLIDAVSLNASELEKVVGEGMFQEMKESGLITENNFKALKERVPDALKSSARRTLSRN